jgi:HSP20 family protein
MSIFDDIAQLRQRLHLAAEDRAQPLHWQPAADVYRTGQGWLVKVELAGVRQEDVELLTSGRMLIVRGKRTDSSIIAEYTLHSLEIAYSSFERSIELPVPLEGARVSIEYRDGMLWIHLLTARDA